MKLFATDLDGTLLNSNHEISKENLEALKLAQKTGTEIVIATGRTYGDVSAICKKANLNPHIISNNGSFLYSKDGEKLKSLTISKKDVRNALTWIYENEYFFEICTDKNLFLLSNSKEILEKDFLKAKAIDPSLNEDMLLDTISLIFSQAGLKFVDTIDEILNADFDYCSMTAVSFSQERLSKGREFFSNYEGLSLVVSTKYNFEMVNEKASKGNLLEYLANHLNIPLKDAVAIGDNYNDVSMFKKAGTSVAMGNADDAIKKICSHVSVSNDLNGVAHIITLKIKSSLA